MHNRIVELTEKTINSLRMVDAKIAEVKHTLQFINKEIENPTPIDTMTMEEKMKILLESKKTCETLLATIESHKQNLKTKMNEAGYDAVYSVAETLKDIVY